MRRTLVPAVAGLLLALTACGGGSGDNAGSGTSHGANAGQPPASNATAPGTGAATDSTSGDLDVCKLLPVSDVDKITGVQYSKAKSSSTMGQIFECEYSDSTFDLLQVSATVVNGLLAYDADVQAMSALQTPSPVSGVGDKAFAAQDPKGNAGAAGVAAFASYGALFGDVYIKIGGSYVNQDQGKQIAEEIDGKL